MADEATLDLKVAVPELAALNYAIGVLVAAVDDLLARLGELTQARTDVLAELQTQVDAGQIEADRLEEVLALLAASKPAETTDVPPAVEVPEVAPVDPGALVPPPEESA